MAHPQQLKFFSIVEELFVRTHMPNIRILEVGSYDVSGSVRQFFAGCEYIGADLIQGPGVDLVCSGHQIEFDDCSFDMALSSECFEHNPYWLETFMNMHRMTKPGGLVVFSCASRGRPEHGTIRTSSGKSFSPGTAAEGWDYYKNLNRSDFENALNMGKLFSAHKFFYMPKSWDLYFCGQKIGDGRFSFDKLALQARIEEIKSLPTGESLPYLKSTLYKLHSMPITAMSYMLTDPTFQNCRERYLDLVRPIAAILKKIMRK